MNDQQDDFQKESPFVTPTQPRQKNGNGEREDGMLRVVTLLISLVSLGIAMASMAYVAINILIFDNVQTREHIWPIIAAIGLAYIIGWIVAVYSIRALHNLVLPMVINIYAWITLFGVGALYIAIISKLYKQEYYTSNFIKYSVVMVAALIALIGLHLLIENHSLILFSIPLLVISLAHLYLIVYHYVFVSDVKYEYLSGDVIFFLGMALVSVLMLMHLGVLSGLRKTIDNLFDKNGNRTRVNG